MQLEGSSRWLYAALFAVSVSACGDDGGGGGGGGGGSDDAGPGGDDTAPVTTASPAPGTYRAGPEVTLTADEPATIYYTLDGSEPTTASDSGESPLVIGPLEASAELRFYAVDAAGNAEAVQSARYHLDRLGPEPVAAFTASAGEGSIELGWIAPESETFAEVLVARVTDAAATVPEDGARYAVGDSLGAGEVVYVGPDLEAAEAATRPGGYLYAAWARHENGVYSEARLASATIAPQGETGQLRIDGAAGTAEIMSSPPSYEITADNVIYDPDAAVLTVDVTVKSNVVGVLYNLKLWATQVNGGAMDADGSGPPGSWRSFGPEALAEGGSITRTLTFSGVLDGEVGVQFALVNSPGFYQVNWGWNEAAASLADLTTGDSEPAWPPGASLGPQESHGYRGAHVTPDGLYFVSATRNSPRVVKIDLRTNTVVAGVDLEVESNTGGLSDGVLDPSGRRYYAVLNDGMHTGVHRGEVAAYEAQGHRPIEDSSVYLVEIDVGTMTEVGRVLLAEGDASLRGRRLALSRDGRTAAVAVGAPHAANAQASLVVVDLSSQGMSDTESFEVENLRPTQPAFTWDGDQVLLNTSLLDENNDLVGVVDLASGELTVHDMDGEPTTASNRAVIFVPVADGSVWCLGHGPGMVSFDPDSGVFSQVGADEHLINSARLAGDRLLFTSNNRLWLYTTDTGDRIGDRSIGGYHQDHHLTLTPFWGIGVDGTSPE